MFLVILMTSSHRGGEGGSMKTLTKQFYFVKKAIRNLSSSGLKANRMSLFTSPEVFINHITVILVCHHHSSWFFNVTLLKKFLTR